MDLNNANNSNYYGLLKKRGQLLDHIQELEAELSELHKQLDDLDAEIEAAKVPAVSLTVEERVELFRSLFRGREDVFARRWFSKKSGKSGYQPVCVNEWRSHLCNKKAYKCAECPNRHFSSLSYHVSAFSFEQVLKATNAALSGSDLVSPHNIRL